MLVHVLLRGPCGGAAWVWRNLPTSVVRGLPHVARVVATGFIACGSGFIPPVGANLPPAPAVYHDVPPVNVVWSPPDTPIGSYPPAWGYSPPRTTELSPPPFNGSGNLGQEIPVSDERGHHALPLLIVKQLCDTPPTILPPPVYPPVPMPPGPSDHEVPEPLSSLAVLGVGLFGLGLTRRLSRTTKET